MTEYRVAVKFLANDEVYGVETYDLDATVRSHARSQALRKSEDSIYYDPRIDFRREVEIEQVDDDGV